MVGEKVSWEWVVIQACCFIIGVLLEDLYGIVDKLKTILGVKK